MKSTQCQFSINGFKSTYNCIRFPLVPLNLQVSKTDSVPVYAKERGWDKQKEREKIGPTIG